MNCSLHHQGVHREIQFIHEDHQSTSAHDKLIQYVQVFICISNSWSCDHNSFYIVQCRQRIIQCNVFYDVIIIDQRTNALCLCITQFAMSMKKGNAWLLLLNNASES